MMFLQVLCVVTVGATIFIHCIISSSLIVIIHVAMLKISQCCTISIKLEVVAGIKFTSMLPLASFLQNYT